MYFVDGKEGKMKSEVFCSRSRLERENCGVVWYEEQGVELWYTNEGK